jgi:hypothetical protein
VIASLPAASLIRIGNFFNSEILAVSTDLPWAIIFSPGRQSCQRRSNALRGSFLLAGIRYSVHPLMENRDHQNSRPHSWRRSCNTFHGAIFDRVCKGRTGFVRARHAPQSGPTAERSVYSVWTCSTMQTKESNADRILDAKLFNEAAVSASYPHTFECGQALEKAFAVRQGN